VLFLRSIAGRMSLQTVRSYFSLFYLHSIFPGHVLMRPEFLEEFLMVSVCLLSPPNLVVFFSRLSHLVSFFSHWLGRPPPSFFFAPKSGIIDPGFFHRLLSYPLLKRTFLFLFLSVFLVLPPHLITDSFRFFQIGRCPFPQAPSRKAHAWCLPFSSPKMFSSTGPIRPAGSQSSSVFSSTCVFQCNLGVLTSDVLARSGFLFPRSVCFLVFANSFPDYASTSFPFPVFPPKAEIPPFLLQPFLLHLYSSAHSRNLIVGTRNVTPVAFPSQLQLVGPVAVLQATQLPSPPLSKVCINLPKLTGPPFFSLHPLFAVQRRWNHPLACLLISPLHSRFSWG